MESSSPQENGDSFIGPWVALHFHLPRGGGGGGGGLSQMGGLKPSILLGETKDKVC